MKKKYYIQPTTKVFFNVSSEEVLFNASHIEGEGPVTIEEGDENEGVDPQSPTFNVWETW